MRRALFGLLMLLLPSLAWGSDTTWVVTDSLSAGHIDMAPFHDDNSTNNFGAWTSAWQLRTTRQIPIRAVGFAIPSGYTMDSGICWMAGYDNGTNLCNNSSGDTSIIECYKLLRDWGEGDNSNTAADAGEVSYTAAKATIQNWTAGGATSSGNDRAASPFFTDTVVGNIANGTRVRFKIDSATCNAWNTANYGFLFQLVRSVGCADGTTFGLTMATDDDASAARRPVFQFWATLTGSPCVVTQDLAEVDVTTGTVTIQDDYTFDAGNARDSLKMFWDDDNNPSIPLDSISVTTGFTQPDTLEASGLTSCTAYYFWWVLYHGAGGCPPDTSDYIQVTTDCPDTTTSEVVIGS